MIDWLHDYWLHTYVTAKYWGVGPQHWTVGIIDEFMGYNSIASSPAPQLVGFIEYSGAKAVACPAMLCKCTAQPRRILVQIFLNPFEWTLKVFELIKTTGGEIFSEEKKTNFQRLNRISS